MYRSTDVSLPFPKCCPSRISEDNRQVKLEALLLKISDQHVDRRESWARGQVDKGDQ